MPTEKITDEQIKKDILKVKEKIGKIPTQDNYKEYGLFSINSILNRKPWNAWLKEIFGIINIAVSGSNGMKVSNDELINNLRELYEKLGRVPKQEELKLGKYSKNAYKRAFGNYSSALKELGLKANVQFNLTDEEILNDIIRISDDIGETPSVDEFNELSKTITAHSVCNRFGTWNNAIKKAGLSISHNQKVSKEEVVEALQSWFKENNNDIGCLEYWALRKARSLNKFPYSTNTISEKFDHKAWDEIMKECGYDYETINQFFKRGCFNGFDGKVYLSSIEKQVGDLLFDLKKDGKIKDYEYEKKVCEDRDWTCDFYIIKNNNVLWLEVDGMSNSRKDPYNSGENEKIEYYKTNNMNYFIITYRLSDIKKTVIDLIGE